MKNIKKCINCNTYKPKIKYMRKFPLKEQNSIFYSIIGHWVSPHMLAEDDFICSFCVIHAEKAESNLRSLYSELSDSEIINSELTKVENRKFCAICGTSVMRTRSKSVYNPSPTESDQKLLDIINVSIGAHRKIQPDTKLCINCLTRVTRQLKKKSNENIIDLPNHKKTEESNGKENVQNELEPRKNEKGKTKKQPDYSEPIDLPNYKKIPYTEEIKCIFPKCSNNNLQTVSKNFQIVILKTYHIYIPSNSMVCNTHSITDNWSKSCKENNYESKFTPEEIEQIFSFVETKTNTGVDFNNFMKIDERSFQYFLGVNKETVSVIMKYLPQINEMDHGVYGLMGLFIKHENGGPDARIANLFKVPVESLEMAMKNVKELLVDNPTVTTNMGIEYLLKKHL